MNSLDERVWKRSTFTMTRIHDLHLIYSEVHMSYTPRLRKQKAPYTARHLCKRVTRASRHWAASSKQMIIHLYLILQNVLLYGRSP